MVKTTHALVQRALLAFAICLLLVSAVVAQSVTSTMLFPATPEASSSSFELSWWTVDGSGGASSGGDYSLAGTAGQAEVGALMRGGAYELAGGFWGVGRQAGYGVYLPVVLRMSP